MGTSPMLIAGTAISAGTRVKIEFPLADLYTYGPLAMPVEVVVCPTVREPDGLAMS